MKQQDDSIAGDTDDENDAGSNADSTEMTGRGQRKKTSSVFQRDRKQQF